MKAAFATCLFALGLACATTTQAAEETPAIDWENITTVTVETDAPAILAFSTQSAGLFSLAVRSDDDGDLQLRVLDEHQVTLEGSQFDIDYRGNRSSEQGAIVIPRAGNYFAVVERRFGRGAMRAQVGASWLSFPEIEEVDFSHSNPSTAVSLTPGDGHEGTISNEPNQPWYWYSITSEAQGQVFLSTRAAEGDLVIEVYRDNAFINYETRVDNDEDGVRGNETANVRVSAGETVYFRVRTHSHRSLREDIPFTVRSAFVDL
ncbi:MAG: hypothetical protein EA401_13420 [Planctomycetota bacterium]|nr:MAG: hypothetical protein EA401_13420 [Planctomycetota bacterium]